MHAEAREHFDRLLAAAEESGAPPGIASAHLGYGFIAHQEGRLDEALLHYDRAREVFAEYGVDPSVAYVRELTGDSLAAKGAATAAAVEWRTAERVYAEYGTTHELTRVRGKLEDVGKVRVAVEGGLISVDACDEPSRLEQAVRETLDAFGYEVIDQTSAFEEVER